MIHIKGLHTFGCWALHNLTVKKIHFHMISGLMKKCSEKDTFCSIVTHYSLHRPFSW